MKFKKIYTLGLGLLIAGMSAVNAQTQDDEKIFYRMDRVKANNPWTKSLNYAGLTFNENQDFTIVELDFQYGKGNFRNVNAPHAFNKTSLQTESFRRLNKVFFYGKFSFDYMNRLKMGWCNVINPYRSPIFFADSMPGRQTLETYMLEGGIGYMIGNHWCIGAKIDYLTASNAKKKDARNKNTYVNLKVYPGVVYRSQYVNLGLNFIYQREIENINIRTIGTGRTPELLSVEGLWFYTSEQVTSTTSITRDIQDEALGGAAQVEFYTSRIRFFNQFSMLEKKQEIFNANYNKERGGEMKQRVYNYTGALNISGEKFSHYMNLQADFSNMLGYENIQQKEVINQNSTWTQFGKKNKSSIESIVCDANYNLFRNRTAYNSCWNAQIGAKGFYAERVYRLYPAKFQQILKNMEGYLSFEKNFLLKKGMLDCGIHGAYTIGGGTMLKMKQEAETALPNIDEYPQRKDLLEQEFEYIASDKIAGSINVRYTYFLNKEKGMNLYAIGHVNYKKSTSGLYDGKDWTTLQATIGLSF